MQPIDPTPPHTQAVLSVFGPLRSGIRTRIAMAAIALVATAVQTLPSLAHPGSRIPIGAGSDSDALFTAWTMRTAAANLATGPRKLYRANIFWPRLDGLAFSDGLLAYAPFHALFRRVLGENGGYTAMVFLSYLLAIVAMYGLARFFGVSKWSAFLAAMVFSTLPYRSAEVIHIQLSGCFVVILGLLAALRWLDAFRTRDAVLTGVSIGVLWTVSTYLAISLVLSLLVIGVVWLPRRRHRLRLTRRFGVSAAIALLTTLICLTPTIRAYLAIQRAGFLKRPLEQIIRVHIFQLVPSSFYQLFGRRPWHSAGSDALLPSPLVVALFAVAVVSIVIGRIRFSAPVVVDAPHNRVRTFLPPLAAAACFNALFVIGPGHGIMSRPFVALSGLPGLASIRDPSRFIVVVYVLGVLLIALAADLWARSSKRPRAVLVVAALCVVVPLESLYRPQTASLTQARESEAMNRTLATMRPGAVLEVPMPTETVELDRALAYRQFRGLIDNFARPLGFSGGLPPEATIPFHAGRAFPHEMGLAKLRTIGVRYVLVHGPTSVDTAPCNARYSTAALAQLETELRNSVHVSDLTQTSGGLIVTLAPGQPVEPVDLLADIPAVVHQGPRCTNP